MSASQPNQFGTGDPHDFLDLDGLLNDEERLGRTRFDVS